MFLRSEKFLEILMLLSVLTTLSAAASTTDPREYDPQYWIDGAQDQIRNRLSLKKNLNWAKNVILFVGDGMSIQTVAAARNYNDGAEQNSLFFERFPWFGLSKTYCVDKGVPDSACTGTAYSSGVKSNYRTLGVTPNVERKSCTAAMDPENWTSPITEWFQRAGRSTGIVTTARITHASPGAFYAHVADRDWEYDEMVAVDECDPAKVDDIAEQVVYGEIASKMKVMLGGGRRNFRDVAALDEEENPGRRTDRRDLIEEWQIKKESLGKRYAYVWNTTALKAIDPENVDHVLGLFGSGHCSYNLDLKLEGNTEKPTLSEMTESAIKILQTDKNGFFLFVEGGRIDTAHHDARVHKALEETQEFDRAIELARGMTSESDTLIVVTSDHGHTMTFTNGDKSKRGHNIVKKAGTSDKDFKDYPILSYANGPGYKNTYTNGSPVRKDISGSDLDDPEFKYPGTVPLESETHGGDDVGIYASGPQAHLFQGTMEQNVIPIQMAYIAQVETGKINARK